MADFDKEMSRKALLAIGDQSAQRALQSLNSWQAPSAPNSEELAAAAEGVGRGMTAGTSTPLEYLESAGSWLGDKAADYVYDQDHADFERTRAEVRAALAERAQRHQAASEIGNVAGQALVAKGAEQAGPGAVTAVDIAQSIGPAVESGLSTGDWNQAREQLAAMPSPRGVTREDVAARRERRAATAERRARDAPLKEDSFIRRAVRAADGGDIDRAQKLIDKVRAPRDFRDRRGAAMDYVDARILGEEWQPKLEPGERIEMDRGVPSLVREIPTDPALREEWLRRERARHGYREW